MRWIPAVFVVPGLFAAQNQQLADILQRLAEEADVFLHQAPKSISQETLQQRAVLPSGVRTRVIVSEYSYTTIADSLHEIRKVVSVDDRQVEQPESARRSLVLNAVSKDTETKRKLLAEFEQYGLSGAVTDYGPVILLFSKTGQQSMQFQIAGETMVGPTRAFVVNFLQAGNSKGATIFRQRSAIQEPLQGAIFVRTVDLLPIRIVLNTGFREVQGKKKKAQVTLIVESGAVEYSRSRAGVLLPASVVHRELVNGQTVVENLFTYTPFRQFSADAEIKFEVLPDETSKPK